MSKFKKGDRVKIKEGFEYAEDSNVEDFSAGDIVYVAQKNSYNPYIVKDKGDIESSSNFLDENYLELVEEESYTKINPKVGDRFRVKKLVPASVSETLSHAMIGDTFTINKLAGRFCSIIERYGGCSVIKSGAITTEYIEPIEEEEREIRTSEEPINQTTKQTIMQQLTSALKRALSSDKQALYRTGVIGSDLELTTTGRSQYINALFNNEGDHKKAMSEMVEAAKEQIEEARG